MTSSPNGVCSTVMNCMCSPPLAIPCGLDHEARVSLDGRLREEVQRVHSRLRSARVRLLP